MICGGPLRTTGGPTHPLTFLDYLFASVPGFLDLRSVIRPEYRALSHANIDSNN